MAPLTKPNAADIGFIAAILINIYFLKFGVCVVEFMLLMEYYSFYLFI
jgi:hypothetical protein